MKKPTSCCLPKPLQKRLHKLIKNNGVRSGVQIPGKHPPLHIVCDGHYLKIAGKCPGPRNQEEIVLLHVCGSKENPPDYNGELGPTSRFFILSRGGKLTPLVGNGPNGSTLVLA